MSQTLVKNCKYIKSADLLFEYFVISTWAAIFVNFEDAPSPLNRVVVRSLSRDQKVT